MTAVTGPGPEPSADRTGCWQVLTATKRGAAHRASRIPSQDAVATFPIGPDGAVAAVADGHGHSRHFRSARGALLAVTVACRAAHDLAAHLGSLGGITGTRQAEEEMRRLLVPAIVGHWRDAVLEDVAAEPFTPAEDAVRGGDHATIAYGTTLLLAVALGDWLLLAQIGDGDIVGIRPDGTAALPVPGDPQLDGRHTTSLCTDGAEHSFRVAAVDTVLGPLLGVLLATDGYGNAQVARDWEDVVSADLAPLISTRPTAWLADQLPVWAERCASLDGSADDTTIALVLAPGAPAGARGPGEGRTP